MQCFILFFGPNCSGAEAKSSMMLEPEPKNFRCPELESEIWVQAPMSLVRRGLTGVIIAL